MPMLGRSQRHNPTAGAALLLPTLLLAGWAAAQDINVTIEDVSVSLTDNGQSAQGERYTIGSKLNKLTLTCRANSLRPLKISDTTWRLENTNSSPTADARIKVETKPVSDNSTNSVLTIDYPIKSDFTAGYVCVVNQTATATGRFLSVPLLTVKVNGVNEYDAAVWPGDSVTITCLVDGYPRGDIRWTKSVDPAFNVTNNNTIYLSSVKYDVDRGYITCASKNQYGENTAKVFLRVKSPLSYLAPLLAIIGEIVIMLIIVVAYEIYDKRRRRIMDGGDLKSE